MYHTNIFSDKDFCSYSKYRSLKHQVQIQNWSLWAENALREKDLKEIQRAIKKL